MNKVLENKTMEAVDVHKNPSVREISSNTIAQLQLLVTLKTQARKHEKESSTRQLIVNSLLSNFKSVSTSA